MVYDEEKIKTICYHSFSNGLLNYVLFFRHLTARLALGWRIRLTQHLLKNYLRNNAFYKVPMSEVHG